MRKIIAALLAGLSLQAVTAAADVPLPEYHLVKNKSMLKFIAIQNSAPVEGQFKDFSADIRFDPNHLEQSSIMAEVQTGSVTAANEDVSTNVRLPEWLAVEAFPTATFKTTGKLSRMPQSDNYYADGSLTLHGKTVPVVLNFQMEHFDGNTAVATGYVTLKRGDFGIGQGEWSRYDVIKNEVRVEFRVVAEKQ